jgi:plasmid stabilization system protein ParE
VSDPPLRVRWAEEAVRDLEESVGYIAADRPMSARELLAQLRDRAGSLETTPLRGRVVPELARFAIRSLRELVVKPYRIIYRVAEAEVFVLAFLDGRRELEDVLLERLVRSREPR